MNGEKMQGKEGSRMEDIEAAYRAHFDDVYRFLRGLTGSESLAEELTQETFFSAMKHISDYRGESELRVWLCSIARNLYFTHLRKQKHLSPDAVPEDLCAEDSDLTELIADKALAMQIHRVLHSLRDPYKEVFSLRIFGELSFREIGSLFGKNEHWACVTFHRAKNMIQTQMKGADSDAGL